MNDFKASRWGPQPGDLLWLNRFPGGLCLFESVDHEQTQLGYRIELWSVIHSELGLIVDCDYYFDQVKERGEE